MPEALVLGVDSNAAAMAEASRRAARPTDRGGIPNLRFVRAAVERPPVELVGRADVVHVAFPWGSLARGVLGLDDVALAGLACLLRAGGAVRVLASIVDRDARSLGATSADLADADRIAAAWRSHGLVLEEHGVADEASLAMSGSTWGRRLLRDGSRPVARLVGRRLDI